MKNWSYETLVYPVPSWDTLSLTPLRSSPGLTAVKTESLLLRRDWLPRGNRGKALARAARQWRFLPGCETKTFATRGAAIGGYPSAFHRRPHALRRCAATRSGLSWRSRGRPMSDTVRAARRLSQVGTVPDAAAEPSQVGTLSDVGALHFS